MLTLSRVWMASDLHMTSRHVSASPTTQTRQAAVDIPLLGPSRGLVQGARSRAGASQPRINPASPDNRKLVRKVGLRRFRVESLCRPALRVTVRTASHARVSGLRRFARCANAAGPCRADVCTAIRRRIHPSNPSARAAPRLLCAVRRRGSAPRGTSEARSPRHERGSVAALPRAAHSAARPGRHDCRCVSMRSCVRSGRGRGLRLSPAPSTTRVCARPLRCPHCVPILPFDAVLPRPRASHPRTSLALPAATADCACVAAYQVLLCLCVGCLANRPQTWYKLRYHVRPASGIQVFYHTASGYSGFFTTRRQQHVRTARFRRHDPSRNPRNPESDS